ncbi:hypothetical protein GCM10009623_25240 [Nocardioides aestuarii]
MTRVAKASPETKSPVRNRETSRPSTGLQSSSPSSWATWAAFNLSVSDMSPTLPPCGDEQQVTKA